MPSDMNRRLELLVRNADCFDCKLRSEAEGRDVCVTGQGPNTPSAVIVTKYPVGGRSRDELAGYMSEAGMDLTDFMWLSATKCRTWGMDVGKTEIKACRGYLDAELAWCVEQGVQWALVIGNEPLLAVCGRSGITKYRGKSFPHASGITAVPTISPAMVSRNPGYKTGFIADLKYFGNLMAGRSAFPDDHNNAGHRTRIDTKAALRATLTALRGAGVVAYDIETTRGSEYESGARIVSLSFTIGADEHDLASMHTYELPLYHPESPWRRQWRKVHRIVADAIGQVPKRVAHNAKFDTRWMRHFGATISPTFDTIIAASLLDENRSKGLKPLAQLLLGAEPWGIDTKDLLSTPLDQVLEYNGLDTWHTLRLYYVLRRDLIAHPRLMKLFQHVMMGAIKELVDIERRGVYTHADVLAANAAEAQRILDDIETQLMTYVPDTLPDAFYNRRGEPQINFGPSNFARWFLFEHLELPVLARGKPKEDGTEGQPSMAEAIMMELAEVHPVGQLMLDRALWYKRITGFFNPYTDQLDQHSRIHTTFKPWGTVTGRLSSGKEDAEKFTARQAIRGVNLQQVPRDKLIRGVFGAPAGSSFVEADYSQVELRVAAFLAQEQTMLGLYNAGEDIHMAMACRMTGKAPADVTKEERKAAKAVNFGFLYGMGVMKFIGTAWSNYQLRVTEDESAAFRVAFFDQFPRLIPWHHRQRKLGHKYRRVETPMGRVRHLPDIESGDPQVKSEAERQAINSPVQGFASDMALWSMVLVSQRFRKRGIRGHVVGTVHDAVNFEIDNRDLSVAVPLIRYTMENLPLGKVFDVHLNVPIVADVKVGRAWGGAIEIDNETSSDVDAMDAWVRENVTW